MVRIDPKQHKDTYSKQEEITKFALPPKGTYDVVNVALQRQIIGDNKTPKLRTRTAVLKAIETGEGNPGANTVGKTFPLDFWLTDKPANHQRLAWAGIACGTVDAWDPDVDADCIRVLTGVPYRITFDVVPQQNDKTRSEIKVIEMKALDPKVRAAYTQSPDWQKVVGVAKDRMLEKKDFSGSGTTSKRTNSNVPTSGTQSRDPFAADEPPPIQDEDLSF